MKTTIKTILATALATVMLQGTMACVYVKTHDDINNHGDETACWENNPSDRMYFSSANVLEDYELGKGITTECHIVYDDPDANLWQCDMRVDYSTVRKIQEARQSGVTLSGELRLETNPITGDSIFYYTQENSL